MDMKKNLAKIGYANLISSVLGTLVLSLFLIFPELALGQKPVGVVTALKGSAQLTRATTQTALAFKDGVILRDIIDTREESLARILFGGKSTVTIRELTRLEVREEILPSGAIRSVHDLSSGAILINVARKLLRPGDEVVIRTPNAVAAIRGSTIFVEHSNPTTITILSGSAIVTPNGGQPITLIAGQRITLTTLTTGAVVSSDIQTISDEDAEQIQQGEETKVSITDEAGQEETIELEVGQATQLVTAVVQAITGKAPTTSEESKELATAQVQASEGQTMETFAQEEVPNLSQSVKENPENRSAGVNAEET